MHTIPKNGWLNHEMGDELRKRYSQNLFNPLPGKTAVDAAIAKGLGTPVYFCSPISTEFLTCSNNIKEFMFRVWRDSAKDFPERFKICFVVCHGADIEATNETGSHWTSVVIELNGLKQSALEKLNKTAASIYGEEHIPSSKMDTLPFVNLYNETIIYHMDSCECRKLPSVVFAAVRAFQENAASQEIKVSLQKNDYTCCDCAVFNMMHFAANGKVLPYENGTVLRNAHAVGLTYEPSSTNNSTEKTQLLAETDSEENKASRGCCLCVMM